VPVADVVGYSQLMASDEHGTRASFNLRPPLACEQAVAAFKVAIGMAPPNCSTLIHPPLRCCFWASHAKQKHVC